MRKIVICPSHQLHNPCILGDTEAEHCLVIAKTVVSILKKIPDIGNVYLIGTAPSSENTERKRLNWAIAKSNGYNPDIHVSIHTNAPKYSTDHATRGIEAIHYGSTNGKRLATYLYNELYKVFPDRRGVKINKSLAELNGTKAPAAIIEAGFHTNKQDANIIHEVNNVAAAIVEGILKYFGLSAPAVQVDWKAKYYKLVNDIQKLIDSAK